MIVRVKRPNGYDTGVVLSVAKDSVTIRVAGATQHRIVLHDQIIGIVLEGVDPVNDALVVFDGQTVKPAQDTELIEVTRAGNPDYYQITRNGKPCGTCELSAAAREDLMRRLYRVSVGEAVAVKVPGNWTKVDGAWVFSAGNEKWEFRRKKAVTGDFLEVLLGWMKPVAVIPNTEAARKKWIADEAKAEDSYIGGLQYGWEGDAEKGFTYTMTYCRQWAFRPVRPKDVGQAKAAVAAHKTK